MKDTTLRKVFVALGMIFILLFSAVQYASAERGADDTDDDSTLPRTLDVDIDDNESEDVDDDVNDSRPACKELYWFDDSSKECGKKEFCGAFMYKGLHTFKEESQCENALNSGSKKPSAGVSLSIEGVYKHGDEVEVYLVNDKDVSIKYPVACQHSFTITRGNDGREIRINNPQIMCTLAYSERELKAKEKVKIGTWDLTQFEDPVAITGEEVNGSYVNPGAYVVHARYLDDTGRHEVSARLKVYAKGVTPENATGTLPPEYVCAKGCREVEDGCLCPKIKVRMQGELPVVVSEGRSRAVKSIKIEPGDKDIEITTQSGTADALPTAGDDGYEGNSISLPVVSASGQSEIELESDSEKLETRIYANGKQARTREAVVYEGAKLYIEKDNVKKELKIMPDTASAKAIERLSIKIDNIELKDTGVLHYEVSGKEKARVFWIIPVEYEVDAQVSAEDGELVKVKKPWYAAISKRVKTQQNLTSDDAVVDSQAEVSAE